MTGPFPASPGSGLSAVQAADILDALAERQAQALDGILSGDDYDAKALVYSSGDLEVVAAIRAGSEALRARARVHSQDRYEVRTEPPTVPPWRNQRFRPRLWGNR